MRRFATSFFVFLFLLASLNHYVLAQTTTDQKPGSKQVNINSANQAELETLPGIGPSLAKKIMDFRQKNGNFKTIEDLKAVAGIGDKKFEQLKSLITVK
ncbi:MAG TPA: ComEA family DNA-binding protein [Acidobacteriota bacterium]|nr:ComEA family DNA-binding protein [Acidobacteriota bacterium]